MYKVTHKLWQCKLHLVAVANVQTLFKAIILKFKALISHFQIYLNLVVDNFLKYDTLTKFIKLRTK